MVDDDLRAALGSMVERYGLATISRILREIENGRRRAEWTQKD